MTLRCRSLDVRFGEVRALADLDLDLAAGQRLSIVGPSGCGKSTLLRTIAGLVPHAGGTVEWGSADLTKTPPHERRIGFMFQEHALFPHRSVAANVAFGLRMQGRSDGATAARVHEMLVLVDLEHRRDARIDELSGGERQRVALARTLAPEPEIILLDEPLASLDRVLRTELLDEISMIFDDLGVTAIAVTHDLDEAFRFADELAVMSPGRIERHDQADEVWKDPRTEFTARFLGFSPVTTFAAGVELLAGAPLPGEIPAGRLLAVSPGAFAIDPAGSVTGEVVRSTFERGTWRHVIELEDSSEVVVITAGRYTGSVTLKLDPDGIRLVQPTSSAV